MAVYAKLLVPKTIYVNKMPPVPSKIPVSINISFFITNTGASEETFLAMNSCEISTWIIEDSKNHFLIAAEPIEENCLQSVFSLTIKPGETKRYNDTLVINGRYLNDNQECLVKYTYFGNSAEATFKVSVLQ